MQRLLVFLLICLFLSPCPAHALFQKKDYKKIFLNNAYNAEKRKDDQSAFHSYEKALYYYKKDKDVIEAYAKFCERRNFYDKAEALYEKLYIMTKNSDYLFHRDICRVKNGKISDSDLQKLSKAKGLSISQRNELNFALIGHFAYKNDWNGVKNACGKIPTNSITGEIISQCIVAGEKTGDKKSALRYYERFSQIYPKDSEIVNKIISVAEASDNYSLEEKYIKKLIAQNPKDNGIKYKLAGVFEKSRQWAKAVKVYESLISGGDKSDHVKTSLAYAHSQLDKKPEKKVQKPIVTYKPKPLTGYKLAEKNFYEALDSKNYKKAQGYLSQMLKKQPNNPKLLRHKVDVSYALDDYPAATSSFEKLDKIQPLSRADWEFLAFIYSKSGNYSKSIEIIDKLIEQNDKDKRLQKLGLQYSMAQKNWDRAIFYNNRLLELEPNSEFALKTGGDLYSIVKDFPNAIGLYERLILLYPKPAYKFSLTNMYMATQNFAAAQAIIEPVYMESPSEAVIDVYLNSLLAQDKTQQAYWVIKTHHMEKTKNGYMVMGDLAMLDKNYQLAVNNYRCAIEIDSKSLTLQNKLAQAYRQMGYICGPTKIYHAVLEKDPENLQAKIGLGYLEIDKKEYEDSRVIFANILAEHPGYIPAKMGIYNSYIGQDYRMSALETINQVPVTEETNFLKAQTYYDMHMPSNAGMFLRGSATKDSEELKYKIKRDNAITITPIYGFLFQQLADEFKLDYHRFGLNVAQNTDGNKNVFMEYNVYVYTSGGSNRLNNVTNEFRGGIQAKPNEKFEYRMDVGVKAFEFGDGAMIVTNSWIKRNFNDKFSLKLGFYRDNLIQSYLSAVGEYINGVFTGRVADTRTYLEFDGKLPYGFYTFGRGVYGVMYAQNLITNQYLEGMVGIGHLVYNNPKNKWINTVGVDVVSYNSGYQYNLLNIYNSAGKLFGGYFSPGFFTADTINVKLEGKIKKWRLKYGLTFFGGIQNAEWPHQTNGTFGASPYIAYDLNDHVTINASYNYYNYADVQRNFFMINAVIRGFRKNAKK